MINDFWKNPKVKNYLICDIFDIDEVVRCYGGCPNDEDYKIVRSYYYWEWQGGENHIPIPTTKEDYEKYKDNEEEEYRTEINYKDFEDKFWFNEFADFLIDKIEPNEQFDFISFVNETFNNTNFEGQAKIFLKDVFSSLKSFSDDLKIFSKKRDWKGLEKTNKIQNFVIDHYSSSYSNTIDKLANYYDSTYPELINEFRQSLVVNVPEEDNPKIVDIEGVRKFNLEISENAIDFLTYVGRNSKYRWIFCSNFFSQVRKVDYGEYLEQLRAGDNIFFKSMIDVNECFEIFFKDLYFDNVFHKFLIENKIDSETVKKQKVDNLLDGITKMIDYLWEFTSVFEISYTLESDKKNFSKILKEDNLFSYFIIDYHCYINLKSIYDLIINDYSSFVDQTKHKFDYFYSNKKEVIKNIDAVSIVDIENENNKTVPNILKPFKHSEIFKNNAFEVWESMFESFVIVKESRTDVKFIFEAMKKDTFIHNTVSQKSFLDWINKIYSLAIEKTSNHSITNERISIYNTAKSIYKE